MIGIFGGSFDPVHHGHLRIALDAQEALQLDQVRLVPLGHAVHRAQPRASAQQRLAMLRCALGDHPRLFADDREIRRGGSSYMVDTLESLHAELPQQPLCLLLGGDAFNGFTRWRNPQRILELASILVMQRPATALPPDADLQQLVNAHHCADITRFKAIRSGAILFHSVTQLDISSSDIRQRIAMGKDPAFLLPAPVIDYIRQHRLYR